MKARWINNRGGRRTSAPARDAAALHCKTLRALPVILGNCVIIGGIVLAILTARDNIFSAPELSSGKFDFRIAAENFCDVGYVFGGLRQVARVSE